MNIVAIQGSPSAVSRSESLLRRAQSHLAPLTGTLEVITVRELPAQALLQAQFDHPQIRRALAQVAQAELVLVSTPIYKAAYSGVLKAFLDLLPQDGLRGKTILPLATGGSLAHLLALDYALKPVLSALGARDILDPVFATDMQIPRHEVHGYLPIAEIERRLGDALAALHERAGERQRHVEAAREREALLARLA